MELGFNLNIDPCAVIPVVGFLCAMVTLIVLFNSLNKKNKKKKKDEHTIDKKKRSDN